MTWRCPKKDDTTGEWRVSSGKFPVETLVKRQKTFYIVAMICLWFYLFISDDSSFPIGGNLIELLFYCLFLINKSLQVNNINKTAISCDFCCCVSTDWA